MRVNLGGVAQADSRSGARDSILENLTRCQGGVPAFAGKLAAMAAARLLPVGARGRNYFVGSQGSLPFGLAHVELTFELWRREYRVAIPSKSCFLGQAAETATA